MSLKEERSPLSYAEITELALNMPTKEKLRLAEELKRQGLKASWDLIFRTLKPNQVSAEEIEKVSKQVRKKLNTRSSRATTTRRR